MTIKVSIENVEEVEAAAKALGAELSALLELATHAAAGEVADMADMLAPSPVIEKETAHKTAERVEVHVAPDADHWYYVFVERGAQPHEVLPTEAQALQIGDEFIARTNHPGFAADPFLVPAAKSAADDAADAFRVVMGK